MEIVFEDKQKIALIESGVVVRSRLPVAVIKSCRNKLVLLRSAPDERTLRNWKSLHYEKLQGNREGMRSIRLNNQWRLIFKLNDEKDPPSITILEIADYH